MVSITWEQQDSRGTGTVEDFSYGDDIGVISDPAVEAFYVAERVVSVEGERMAITSSKSDHVFYCTKACLPHHRCQILLTLHIGLYIIGWTRL